MQVTLDHPFWKINSPINLFFLLVFWNSISHPYIMKGNYGVFANTLCDFFAFLAF